MTTSVESFLSKNTVVFKADRCRIYSSCLGQLLLLPVCLTMGLQARTRLFVTTGHEGMGQLQLARWQDRNCENLTEWGIQRSHDECTVG